MIERKCIICGNSFRCYPSDKRVTCSKDCQRERARRQIKKSPVKWGEEARKRLSQKGKTSNLRLGTEAAKRSPAAGRFETNHTAKVWTLIDPDGGEHVVRNLRLWARDHTELFDKPCTDKSAVQITSGFAAIAQTLKRARGVKGKPNGATTYFGWRLKKLPEIPD